jgi:hypothetical protein
MEEQPKIIYSSYTEAQKRATAKYREANKEKVNAQRKKYYESRKEKDPDFLQYKRDKAREYYLKKKYSNTDIQEEIKDGVNIELVKIDFEEPMEIEPEETIEEHWQKKSQARDHVPELEEEKPPLAWSNDEVKVDPVIKKERKTRALKPKPNLKLEDLQGLLVPSEPKTPKRPRSKKILSVKDILHSA